MPKLTREQLAHAKYISMADYAAKVDQIKGFKAKLEFTAMYLLSHGMNGAQTDYTFEEAVHLARVKLADESKKLREELSKGGENAPDPSKLYLHSNPNAVDPYAQSEKDDIENQFFMGNPAVFLKEKAKQYAREIKPMGVELPEFRSFRENCERLSPSLNGAKSRDIILAENKDTSRLDIIARMEQKYRGRENFLKGEASMRPSFFTRAFGTRSTAGKNLDEVYAAYNNPKHALYGNKEALKIAATQYLDYKASKRSALENAAGLRVKEPKEGFAERLLDAINEQEKTDEIFKPMANASYQKNLTKDDVDRIKGPELEESKTREPLILDLDDDKEEELIDEAEESKDLIEEKEVEAEEPAMEAQA